MGRTVPSFRTVLAAIVVATTAVMLIGGLTVIPPFAEAQDVKEKKDKQKNKYWYCFSVNQPRNTNTMCHETMNQCQSEAQFWAVTQECHEEKKPPAGADCPIPGEPYVVYTECDEL